MFSRLFWFPDDEPAASLQETLLPTCAVTSQYCARFPFQNSSMVQILTRKSCFSDAGEENEVALCNSGKEKVAHSEPVQTCAKVAFMVKRLWC